MCTAVSEASGHDWLDYLSGFSGLLGVAIAVYAIYYASQQAEQTRRDVIRERRAEFDLGLLVKLRHQMSLTGEQHISGYVDALIRDPADEEDLPITRAVVQRKAGPLGTAELAKLKGAAADVWAAKSIYLPRMEREVDEAIQRRLTADAAETSG
ncbi:hypothetical protein [Branchiibius cervicis]|uniref:Uncharacterized protein n=1 Tax=Branchiibius cervicis TaxID=908252 RepID=A0ABW2ANZ7_9MICO